MMLNDAQIMLLNDLMKPWLSDYDPSISISGLTLDSRQIFPGYLFIALQGVQYDGRLFIEQSIKMGACAVFSETKNRSEHGRITIKSGVPVFEVYKLAAILSALAYRFFFGQSKLHKVIAVTGTNGKTTIASLLADSFMLLGKQSAQMGTIGNGLFGQLKSSLNTTLDAISVFSELHCYQQQGVEYTIMEVSSHGLDQGRVSAVPFFSAIFTNLTRDHLDYHGSMENYHLAKKTLFEKYPLKQRIINTDDPIGAKWLSDFPDAIGYGFHAEALTDKQSYLRVTDVDYHAQGVTFAFHSSWGKGSVSAPFYGDFNVSNLAAVVTQLLVENISIEQVQTIFPRLSTVPGRMEQYYFAKQNITFVVDYAHTPDALEKVLLALQKHKSSGRLICVFGCGGDRDTGKRPQMAKIAEHYAQKVVLVDDNPRTENAQNIIKDILPGFTRPDEVKVIHDRKQAINFLLDSAQSDDIVLLAGKGHEDYQIFGKQRVHYSDRECLAALQKSAASGT
ncbi:UDP-N-acetylmuramoyl-L-alanyl-D-glutamate--2,6-diaminopimelate ligase [Psychromonas sp. MB-3u-54]|uniref:UDP-N-acetylmuramoyl-L-alanyl-D-glutamate--2, 6-diaminopimelate ligase n=1 Tax=Psychromonas sp. MB-3u-54 TaxID=2058319 RepID=UPI001E3D5D2D|nr:UDP-N-acetylmuramoyl-L-alanyl-D-glutamate--2,6-diaminopimelate ligase [Psychromonas sp. MB-3u-54]